MSKAPKKGSGGESFGGGIKVLSLGMLNLNRQWPMQDTVSKRQLEMWDCIKSQQQRDDSGVCVKA